VRFDPELARTLDATGKPWHTTKGSRHTKLFLGDRLVGILPRSGKLDDTRASRAKKNLLTQIRRAAQDMETNR
jgi:hypothetical protein